MTARDNIADIVCIGCQKGSTSWLHSVINCHPQVWAFPESEPVTSTNKEAHYWDWNHHRGPDWYRSLMTPPTADRLTLDFTPEYAFLSDAQIEECKALNPTAKIIYVLRDPLARAVSTMRMLILWNHGADHKEPLEFGEDFDKFTRNSKLDQHGDYLRNVTAWKRHYSDMLVINYEDFHVNRVQNVDWIFSQLGLDKSAITGHDAHDLARLMNERVWASEKFAIDRAVLLFLHGLTWEYRQQAEQVLGMKFTEGARLLEG